MIFIWRGFGFLVPVMLIGFPVLAAELFGENTYEQHAWPKLLAFVAAAIAILLAGDKLNRNRPSGNTHTFFFLDMEVWALISVVIGIVAAVHK
jgi:hypothetical protein